MVVEMETTGVEPRMDVPIVSTLRISGVDDSRSIHLWKDANGPVNARLGCFVSRVKL